MVDDLMEFVIAIWINLNVCIMGIVYLNIDDGIFLVFDVIIRDREAKAFLDCHWLRHRIPFQSSRDVFVGWLVSLFV